VDSDESAPDLRAPTGAALLRVGLGATVALARPARAAAGVGLRVAAVGWQSRALWPVRYPLGALLAAAEQSGLRDEARLLEEGRRASADLIERIVAELLDGETLERLIAIAGEHRVGIRAADALLAGDGAERLVAHLVDQPALDTLVARVIGSEAFDARVVALLDDPALERLLARALASRFADAATEQVLASDELRRVVAHVAASDEVRQALSAQSAGLATDVADEIRDRTTTADDVLERGVRRILRRRPRGAPTTEIADAPASGP
jgi:hypothetical protein